MLEAASFPRDNKIVSQVARNIMGLMQQRRGKFSLLKKTCSCNWRALSRFSRYDFFERKTEKLKLAENRMD